VNKIKSNVSDRTLQVRASEHAVAITVRSPEPNWSPGGAVTVDRNEFFTLISKEMEVDVVDASSRPEVRLSNGLLEAGSRYTRSASVTTEALDENIVALLAIRKYVVEHLLLDEKAVEEAAALIHAIHPSPALSDEIARHLVANGWGCLLKEESAHE